MPYLILYQSIQTSITSKYSGNFSFVNSSAKASKNTVIVTSIRDYFACKHNELHRISHLLRPTIVDVVQKDTTAIANGLHLAVFATIVQDFISMVNKGLVVLPNINQGISSQIPIIICARHK